MAAGSIRPHNHKHPTSQRIRLRRVNYIPNNPSEQGSVYILLGVRLFGPPMDKTSRCIIYTAWHIYLLQTGSLLIFCEVHIDLLLEVDGCAKH